MDKQVDGSKNAINVDLFVKGTKPVSQGHAAQHNHLHENKLILRADHRIAGKAT